MAAAAEVHYRHLSGPARVLSWCFAAARRFCAEGERLREAYFAAAWEAEEARERRH